MTETARLPPATDEEISQYAADCATADVDRCGSCFAGPAMAGCSSFLCERDVLKLLARIEILKAERDDFHQRWLSATRELEAANRRIGGLTQGIARPRP